MATIIVDLKNWNGQPSAGRENIRGHILKVLEASGRKWYNRNMKCTQYFSFIKQRPDRAIIKEEWILDAIKKPVKTEIQNDGRIRQWKFIEEAGKCLRVILLEDGETVHNAFFDRNFKEGEK